MSYNILVVDDSRLARMAVAKALNVDYPTWTRLEAANADEALAHIKDSRVDIALLDFNMPGRDGLELAADLRALKPGLPVAIISANHQDEVVEHARSVGATFLPKPLTVEALRAFLANALQHVAGAR